MDRKTGWVFLLIVLLILWFSKPAFAALTITDVSPTTINSAEDVITITASASGLSNSTQYLQIAFTKEGNPTNYLGLTKNGGGEWYLYKSSPALSDLNSYFYSFTPVASTWSGQIQGKFDINDDGFVGPGNYILKLLKYISSSGSPSNNSFIVAVNITASPSSQSPPAPDASSPEMSIDMNENYNLGETFRLRLKLENFPPDKNHFVKVRAGTTEDQLNKGQTQNGTTFYADNENWDKFPLIKTNSSGLWEGEISGRVGEDKSEGKYKVRIRVRESDNDTFYDSPIKEANFLKVAAPAVVSPTPTAKVVSSSGTMVVSSSAGAVLGSQATDSATLFHPATPASKISSQSPESREKEKTSRSNKISILAGGLSILAATVIGFGGSKLWGIIRNVIRS